MNRKLDGCYFRIERNGEWQNICFTDLTTEERAKVLEGKSTEWLKSLCCHLGDIIRMIGDQLDVYKCEYGGD